MICADLRLPWWRPINCSLLLFWSFFDPHGTVLLLHWPAFLLLHLPCNFIPFSRSSLLCTLFHITSLHCLTYPFHFLSFPFFLLALKAIYSGLQTIYAWFLRHASRQSIPWWLILIKDGTVCAAHERSDASHDPLGRNPFRTKKLDMRSFQIASLSSPSVKLLSAPKRAVFSGKGSAYPSFLRF